jgi:hypothetical protein
MDTYHCTITLTQPLLGTVAKGENAFATASKAQNATPGDDEMETVPEPEERPSTGFHMLDGKPILYDYMIKGYMKDACSMLKRVDGMQSGKIKAFKKIIDGLVFVQPRQITLDLHGQPFATLERPLRAQTPQGERVAIAKSDMVPAGSTLDFDIVCLGEVSEALLREWLDYGRFRGLGQWRNGGYGRFVYDLERK